MAILLRVDFRHDLPVLGPLDACRYSRPTAPLLPRWHTSNPCDSFPRPSTHFSGIAVNGNGDGGPGSVSTSKPNVFFFLVDDMGFGDIGYQSTDLSEITPNLDALAAGGVKARICQLEFIRSQVFRVLCMEYLQLLPTWSFW